MKTTRSICALSVITAGWMMFAAQSAAAAPIYGTCTEPTNSYDAPEYHQANCGTFEELISPPNPGGQVESSYSVSLLAEWGDGAWKGDAGGAGFALDTLGKNYGTWELPFDALYILIKGGGQHGIADANQFAVYSLGGGASSGEWATLPLWLAGARLNPSELSGLRFYGHATPVPAPGALALLGAGMLGVALLRRRRRHG